MSIKKHLTASQLTAGSNMFIPSSRLVFTALLVSGLPSLGGCAAAGVAAALGAIGAGNQSTPSLQQVEAFASSLGSVVSPSDPNIRLAAGTYSGDSLTFTRTYGIGGSTSPVVANTSVVTLAESGSVKSATISAPNANLSFSPLSASYGITGAGLGYNGYSGQPDGPGATSSYLTVSTLSYLSFGVWEKVVGTKTGNSLTYSSQDLGVFAVGTASASIPSNGSFSYSGAALGFIMPASSSYQILGDVSASFNFGSGTGAFSLANARQPAGSSCSVCPNFSDFNFSSSVSITGNTFAGNTTAISGGTNIGVRGKFFGPNANEIGGTIKFGDIGLAAFGASR